MKYDMVSSSKSIILPVEMTQWQRLSLKGAVESAELSHFPYLCFKTVMSTEA